MKAVQFKIQHARKSSVRVDYERLPRFYGKYHIHDDLQFMFILKGHGTAYIGDSIQPFEDGNIFLLGQNLPHVFKDKPNSDGGDIEYISVFFLPEFLGNDFLELPESKFLSSLLSEASRGIKIDGLIKKEVENGLWAIYKHKGLARLIELVKTLELLANSETLNFISSPGYHKPKRLVDGQKINDVFDFMMANYSREISLEEVSEVAHMSVTAFCRYFKQHTRKTYSRFLNEIRVDQACKLLIDDEYSISSICFNSGFNNISNFNRQFKKITGFTPSKYQREHR